MDTENQNHLSNGLIPIPNQNFNQGLQQQQGSGPFETVLFGNQTFATLYNELMGKLKTVENVNLDMFEVIHQKIMLQEPVSTETLLILGPIAKEYIEEARLLVETYIKLMQTMASIAKSNNLIVGQNVNFQVPNQGGTLPVHYFQHIDPLKESYDRSLHKEIKPDAIPAEEKNEKEETTSHQTGVRLIHSPDYERRQAKKKEQEKGTD